MSGRDQREDKISKWLSKGGRAVSGGGEEVAAIVGDFENRDGSQTQTYDSR